MKIDNSVWCGREVLQSELIQSTNQQYIVSFGYRKYHEQNRCVRMGKGGRNICILVALSSEANGGMKAKAYLHAMLLGYEVLSNMFVGKKAKIEMREVTDFLAIEQNVAKSLDKIWPEFEKSVKQVGWNLVGTELSSEGYEIHVN